MVSEKIVRTRFENRFSCLQDCFQITMMLNSWKNDEFYHQGVAVIIEAVRRMTENFDFVILLF